MQSGQIHTAHTLDFVVPVLQSLLEGLVGGFLPPNFPLVKEAGLPLPGFTGLILLDPELTLIYTEEKLKPFQRSQFMSALYDCTRTASSMIALKLFQTNSL